MRLKVVKGWFWRWHVYAIAEIEGEDKDSKKLDEDRVEIEKENLTEIKEEPVPEEEDIIIDETSGETIPPLGRGKRGFPNRKSNKLEPKYDYDAEYAFKEKKNDLDGGKF